MPKMVGTRGVGYFDCAGGGQVVVDGNYAYIGHIDKSYGTSIVDVSDPKNPRHVNTIPAPAGVHSHKVRVANDLMLVNREYPPIPIEGTTKTSGEVGLEIYDVSNPNKVKQICMWPCAGYGVHRFTFDGRYAYISPEMDGYLGNILVILDLENPAKPREVSRWWMPGQWTAGGEEPTWQDRDHRCHHAIRMGDRLYVSYWQGGFAILDCSDLSNLKYVSGLDWSPPFPWPTHSAVPVPFPIFGRKWLLVSDEDVLPIDPEMSPEMPAFMWMVDVTDETKPVPVGSFQVDGVAGKRNPQKTGCHQPIETITSPVVPFAWFAQGLRFIDISNPHAPKEVASFVPDVPEGAQRVQSNDVYVDNRDLVYLIDRNRGLHIVERT